MQLYDNYPITDKDYHTNEMSLLIRISNIMRQVPYSGIHKDYWVYVRSYLKENNLDYREIRPNEEGNSQASKLSMYRRMIKFFNNGPVSNNMAVLDLRAWELFTILSGWYPAGATKELKSSVDILLKNGLVNPEEPLFTRRKLQTLLNTNYENSIFSQLCCFSLVHIINQARNDKQTKQKMSLKNFKLISQMVLQIIERWELFIPNIGKSLAPYIIFDTSSLKIVPVSPGYYAMKSASRSLCIYPQETKHVSMSGYDLGDRENTESDLYRSTAKEFCKSLYNIAHYYQATTLHKEVQNQDLARVMDDLRKAFDAGKHGPVVGTDLQIHPDRLIVQRFPKSIVLFLKQECKLKPDINGLMSTPFHKWDYESRQKVIRYGIQSSTTLRSIDAGNNNTYIGESKIAGNGLFAAKVFAPNETIGPFYGLRVTEDISARTGMDLGTTFGPEGYKSTKRHFMTSAISSYGGRKGEEKSWIVPAFFCSVAYANDPRIFVDGKPTQNYINPDVPENCNAKRKNLDKYRRRNMPILRT